MKSTIYEFGTTGVIRGPQRRIKRPGSPTQLKRRNAFRICRNFWMGKRHTTSTERWLNFATGNQTAYNAFLRINLVRVFNDLPILPFPPDDF